MPHWKRQEQSQLRKDIEFSFNIRSRRCGVLQYVHLSSRLMEEFPSSAAMRCNIGSINLHSRVPRSSKKFANSGTDAIFRIIHAFIAVFYPIPSEHSHKFGEFRLFLAVAHKRKLGSDSMRTKDWSAETRRRNRHLAHEALFPPLGCHNPVATLTRSRILQIWNSGF